MFMECYLREAPYKRSIGIDRHDAVSTTAMSASISLGGIDFTSHKKGGVIRAAGLLDSVSILSRVGRLTVDD